MIATYDWVCKAAVLKLDLISLCCPLEKGGEKKAQNLPKSENDEDLKKMFCPAQF